MYAMQFKNKTIKSMQKFSQRLAEIRHYHIMKKIALR